MSHPQGAGERAELVELVGRARHELRTWTDQADSDPGVALSELFAMVGDLLVSHGERLAEEGYLGSARRGASGDRRREIELEVDGEAWLQVTNLAGSASEDHHFLVSRRDDGTSVIEFGDGVHGQRPPSGSSIGIRHKPAGPYSSVLLNQGHVVVEAERNEEPPRGTCGLYRAIVLDNADPLGQERLLVEVPEVSGHEPLWAAACLPVTGAEDLPAVGRVVWIALESGDPSRPVWLGQRVIG